MDDQSMLLEHVAAEFMEAIEKKDKGLLVEALTALVLYIKDEDEKQDSKEEE